MNYNFRRNRGERTFTYGLELEAVIRNGLVRVYESYCAYSSWLSIVFVR